MKMTNEISRGQLLPLLFSQDSIADAQNAVAMNLLEAGASVLSVLGYPMPFDYDIVGISIYSDSARTAGTATVDVTVGGTATGIQAALNATDTTKKTTKVPRGTKSGGAGDVIGAKLTTASWTPVAADIVVIVWVLVRLEGI